MRRKQQQKAHLSIPAEPKEREQPPPKHSLSTTEFWSGEFGNEYTQRNRVDWAKRVPFWTHILDVTSSTQFLDVGCNAGWNMSAVRSILIAKGYTDEIGISGVDINAGALIEAQLQGFDVHNAPACDVASVFGSGVAGLAATSGVLIHLTPQELRPAMQAIVDVSSQYVLAVEYEADVETEVEYRGHAGKLWKRPFGKLYEELGLSLVEYGQAEGFDSCAYWLMEKSA